MLEEQDFRRVAEAALNSLMQHLIVREEEAEAGFEVEAYPVAWRTRPRGSFTLGGTLSGGLNTLDLATHEWLGLIFYRLTGRTGALLPAP